MAEATIIHKELLPPNARFKASKARKDFEYRLRRVLSWHLPFGIAVVAGGIHAATGFPAIVPAAVAYGVYAFHAGRSLERRLHQAALDIVHEYHKFFRSHLGVGQDTTVLDQYHVSIEAGGHLRFVPKKRGR